MEKMETQEIENKLGRIKREMLGNEALRILRSVEVFKLIRKRAIIEFEHIAAEGYNYLQKIYPECAFFITGSARTHNPGRPTHLQVISNYRYVLLVRRPLRKDIVLVCGRTAYQIQAHARRMGSYPRVDDFVLYDKGVVVPLSWSAPKMVIISTTRPALIRLSITREFEKFFKNIPVDLYKVYNYIRGKGICV